MHLEKPWCEVNVVRRVLDNKTLIASELVKLLLHKLMPLLQIRLLVDDTAVCEELNADSFKSSEGIFCRGNERLLNDCLLLDSVIDGAD